MNKKRNTFFFCFQWFIWEGSACRLVRRKSHSCFHHCLGQRPLGPSQPARCRALQIRRAGGLHPNKPHISHLCREALGLCRMQCTDLMDLRLITSSPCPGSCLGGFIKLLLWRRVLESLWLEICPSLCLHPPSGLCQQTGLCSDSSKQKGNLR